MRGKADCQRGKELPFGITPAHAGKSKSADKSRRRKWDHPRACGEKTELSEELREAVGSPPRMRGKGVHPLCARLRSRITPAHAGKSAPS